MNSATAATRNATVSNAAPQNMQSIVDEGSGDPTNVGRNTSVANNTSSNNVCLSSDANTNGGDALFFAKTTMTPCVLEEKKTSIFSVVSLEKEELGKYATEVKADTSMMVHATRGITAIPFVMGVQGLP